MPWRLRRVLLNKIFGYKIHKTARIGFGWVYPGHLEMGEHARIDHFNVLIHLDTVHMDSNAYIGRSNWITGTSAQGDSPYFKHQTNRRAELLIGKHSNITKNHHIDCTNSIVIGDFVTIAGYDSQFLTHSIDVYENRQDSLPIRIGDYTFVGTNSVILGGSVLPAHSVLGAKSLLNKAYSEEWKLYAGVPARAISDIGRDAKYFNRTDGHVY